METTQQKNESLRGNVAAQIRWDPRTTSSNIMVSVNNAVVTLTGFVTTYAEKHAAEKAAQSVYGVAAVANDIVVKPAGTHFDPEIASNITHAMKMDVMVPDDKIKVAVSDGLVTLHGTVEWDFQRRAAEACTRNISGVRGIINNITLKAHASPGVVSARIEDALRRNAELDARRIFVTASDGRVQLSGNVRSWAERDEAERAAWAAPGVTDVVDHIAVVP